MRPRVIGAPVARTVRTVRMRVFLCLLMVGVAMMPTWRAFARPASPPGPAPTPEFATRLIANFAWLGRQRTEITAPGGTRLAVWRVPAACYPARALGHEAGPPPPELAGRPDLISTDDMAWVALAYLKAVQVDAAMDAAATDARNQACQALRTLLFLQRPDGTFPAWSAPSATSPASAAEADWVATARATQALGAGLRGLGPADPLATELETGLGRVAGCVRALWALPDHGVTAHLTVDGAHAPAWLPANRADVAAGLALGLTDWLATNARSGVRDVIISLCDGIQDLQSGTASAVPWMALRPRADAPCLWYPDGAFQAAALIRAATVLGKAGYLRTAEAEVNSLYPHVLASSGLLWQCSPAPQAFPQLPGAAAAMAANATELLRATGQERYAVMAGLFGGWFGCGSGGGQAPYDASSGQCSDLLASDGVASAASPGAAARALWTIMEVGSTRAGKYLAAHATGQGIPPLVLECVDARPVRDPFGVEFMDLPGGRRRVARMGQDRAMWLLFQVAQAASYRVDLVYLEDPSVGRAVDVRLDGDDILEVSLDVASGGQFLKRVKSVPPTDLASGLHTLGVRSGGLWHSGDVVLEKVILQPLMEWRAWGLPGGHRLTVLKNMAELDGTSVLPAVCGPGVPHYTSGWDAAGHSVSLAEHSASDGRLTVTVPTHGFGLLEW